MLANKVNIVRLIPLQRNFSITLYLLKEVADFSGSWYKVIGYLLPDTPTAYA